MKLLIGARQLQKYLQMKGHYQGAIDGIFGQKSFNAARNLVLGYGENYDLHWFDTNSWAQWSAERLAVAAVQILFKELEIYGDNVDGLLGPNTEYALERYQNMLRDTDDDDIGQKSTRWPRYHEMEQYYGPVGQNIMMAKLPYPMRIAWDTDTVVSKISLHMKCAESAIAVLEEARDYYGGPSAMTELRLDLFGGSLNVRKMRGGSRWSTHAWAAAMDIDPQHNQFRWNDSRASLDEEVYDKWWKLWEARGWVSLGRERNFDWMHVQAVRL